MATQHAITARQDRPQLFTTPVPRRLKRVKQLAEEMHAYMADASCSSDYRKLLAAVHVYLQQPEHIRQELEAIL